MSKIPGLFRSFTSAARYSNKSNVLVVGWGNMGSSFGHGLRDGNIAIITAVSPTFRKIDGVEFYQSVDGIQGKKFDSIIAAVKPQVFGEIFSVDGYHRFLKDNGVVISLAAGLSLETIEKFFPDSAIVRAMPNLPAKVGYSLTGAVANKHTSEAQREYADTLLSAVGKTIWVKDEKAINAITAASGSGPGYFFEIMREFSSAVEKLGFTKEEARVLTIHTMLGTAKLAHSSEKSFEDLRNAVTSKGGTTAAGLAQLMEDGELGKRFERTTQAAFNRAEELAEIAAGKSVPNTSTNGKSSSSLSPQSNSITKE